jgi:hypothetical protein
MRRPLSAPIATVTPVPRTKFELDVRRARSAVYTLNAHLVFVSKYRRPVFTDPMLTCCEHLIREVCAGVGAELREFNGETDHVHLLVHYPPSLAPSMWLTGLKACRLAGYASGIPPMCGNTCGSSISGHRRTSPPPAAAHA